MLSHFRMKIKQSSLLTKSLPIAIGSLLLTAASSFAVSISFSTSVGVQPGNVGKITLTQISATTVDVLLDLSDTSDPAPKYGLLNTGGPHTPFAFSISGTETGVTSSFIQPSGGIFSFGLLSLNLGGGGNTPFGTYGIAIDSSAGNGSGNAYYGDLQFRLTRAGGLLMTDFVANTDGYYFAADLTNGSNTGAQAWGTPDTPSVVPNGGTVPDGGATLTLLGLALSGLGIARRAASKA